ncbi:hypothetical protein ACFVMC_24940 [Nocardia sp. NPDC127579]|uniref:Rv0361 family membrane protein n=1 Tax=Nocardia sp. NPDC127579 TaxID=3345402 RepID=UPI00363ECFDD
MRVQPRPAGGDAGADDAETVAMGDDEPADDIAADDAKTVAMKIVPPVDDAQTTVLPIQKGPDQQATQKFRTDGAAKPAGADRVPPRAAPMSKLPQTPRPASGPKQPGKQGPAPQQQQGRQGPAPHQQSKQAPPPQQQGKQAAPQQQSAEQGFTAQQPGKQGPTQQPRRVPQAQSPADVQMTLPVQSVFQPAGPQQPPQRAQHQQPIAAPQRVEPASPAPAPAPAKNKRVLIGAGVAAAVVVALVAGGAALANQGDDSPQAQVRSAIDEYTGALQDGDLAALRDSTCGPLHDYYAQLAEADFAGVHRLSVERKTIPMIDAVDAIQITDRTALAQAMVYTAADPSKKSARTFDLEQTGEGWKVCDRPAGS